MKKRKILFKTVIFTLIFIFCLSSYTDALKFKSREKLQESKEQVTSLPKDSVDVLLLGASGVYAGISPINLWNEYGITSFNLASSNQAPLLSYYTFLETIRYQKPEVLVVDFVSLTVENTPERWEAYYLRALDGILDRRLKIEAVNAMDKEFDISKISYLVPFFRYHHRWSELEKGDFVDLNEYEPYTLGGYMSENIVPVEFSENHMDPTVGKLENYETSEKYYKKLINLAKENDIEVLAISPPRVRNSYGRHLAIKDFCEENGVKYLDYNLEENFQELNLDLDNDFYDELHVNKYGNKKLTSHIGKYLSENYSIEDKKNNDEYSYWNELYGEYLKANGI